MTDVRAAPALQVVVLGRPAPQGSKRSFQHRSTGAVVTVESGHDRVQSWREDVKQATFRAMEAGHAAEFGDAPSLGPAALDGPLVLAVVFTLPKPKSAPKTRRTWPDRTPDLSKLIRSTEDALTDVGAIADDARIVEYVRLAKVFPGEDPDALAVPGAVIRIWRAADVAVSG